ncbi:CsbD family protein [Legionella londiniensis]|uniref:Stress response protein n=1 Tax=Legionella londiniensis TaxID=45068 RepID=A0A0W0VLY5_9GAMM|nr:CsbD family protein [Legionella londiniensis]KTD21054.1 stress response protein [Legionella londiniensis]STX93119.1 General stress response protein [Legionella londiniensis]
MNRDIFEGKWEEIKGKLRQTWGKLTDNDLQEIKGDQEVIFGKLQQYYGYTKEEIKEQIDKLNNQ